MKYYDVQQSGRLFLTHIRKYNITLALASIQRSPASLSKVSHAIILLYRSQNGFCTSYFQKFSQKKKENAREAYHT